MLTAYPRMHSIPSDAMIASMLTVHIPSDARSTQVALSVSAEASPRCARAVPSASPLAHTRQQPSATPQPSTPPCRSEVRGSVSGGAAGAASPRGASRVVKPRVSPSPEQSCPARTPSVVGLLLSLTPKVNLLFDAQPLRALPPPLACLTLFFGADSLHTSTSTSHFLTSSLHTYTHARTPHTLIHCFDGNLGLQAQQGSVNPSAQRMGKRASSPSSPSSRTPHSLAPSNASRLCAEGGKGGNEGNEGKAEQSSSNNSLSISSPSLLTHNARAGARAPACSPPAALCASSPPIDVQCRTNVGVGILVKLVAFSRSCPLSFHSPSDCSPINTRRDPTDST
jgi:hypothetical protein